MPTGSGAAGKHGGVHRLVFLLLLVIAAFVQLTTVSRTWVDTPLLGEPGSYFSYAWNLQEYGTYSSARSWPPMSRPASVQADKQRPPGYPLFIRALGKPSPEPGFLMRVVYAQAGLGIATVALVYFLGLRFLPRNWALLPAALTGISPQFAVASTYLLPEVLLTFLITASVLATVAAVQSGRRSLFIAAGLLWGVAALVSPTTALIPTLILVGGLALPTLRRVALPGLLGLACCLAVLSPWFIRNQGIAGQDAAHRSASVHKVGGPHPGPVPILDRPRRFLAWSSAESSDILLSPVRATPMYEHPVLSPIRSTSHVIHWPLMALALATALGLAIPRLRKHLPRASLAPVSLTAATFVLSIAVHGITTPAPRFATPFRPLAYALAMFGLLWLWKRLRPDAAQASDADGHFVTPGA
jgi:4-amino-4-deoxy-L-arabinose transferase-like glycosyltransferase